MRLASPHGNGGWASLYRSVGSRSRSAGIGFVVLTILLVALSYYTQYIIFEVDSVVSFVVAIVLLFSEPRKRVQSRVLDAVLVSPEQTVLDLTAGRGPFGYFPRESGVYGTVLLPLSNGESIQGPVVGAPGITPPGRALAELFVKEAGVLEPTLDSLEASLPQALTESFGLAGSVSLKRDEGSFTAILRSPSFQCNCGTEAPGKVRGVAGCAVASFLAVLVCASARRPLVLEGCNLSPDTSTCTISMTLGARAGP